MTFQNYEIIFSNNEDFFLKSTDTNEKRINNNYNEMRLFLVFITFLTIMTDFPSDSLFQHI